ncbi:hypothetical protein [Paractinoplanes durhamensis]|uniref:hypothetical protein n=1 Tax=Paractinoplanes durhamensis TaxID=113563 RepID=UPI0031D65E30
MSKNRRRPTRHAEIAEQVADVPEAQPAVDAARSRRRSARPDDFTEQSAEQSAKQLAGAAEPQPADAGRNRRRSARPDPAAEQRAATGDRPRAEPTRTVGALSGQLPPGTTRQAGEIHTDAGRYLRQAARDDAPARYGTPAGDVDESARRVWEIAFGLVVRRRFEPDSPLAEISRTVALAVHEHASAALPMLDAEMLVRHALGEIVPIGDIDGGIRLAVHLLLFASIADELALGEQELDAIIADAEEKADALVPA